MTRKEAVNWIINISADIGKAEHRDLWHYEQALSEIKEMLESLPDVPDINDGDMISRQAAIDAIVAWTVEDRPDIEMPTDLVGRINVLPSVHPE